MSEENGSAIEVHHHETALAMVVEPSEAMRRLGQLQDFVRQSMKEDVDYGVIPGTDKPTLLQPGAQKLAEIYGFTIDYEDRPGCVEDYERPLFVYKKRCVLKSKRDGAFVGAGVGSCNSLESKYGARWVFEREVPAHLDHSKLPRKERISKKNGRPFVMYQVPNDKIFDQVNTLEKMACKRALVMAVIGATRSAGIFTQDMEDLHQEAPDALGGTGKVEDVEEMEQPYAERASAPKPAPGGADVTAFIKAYELAATIDEVRAVSKSVQPTRHTKEQLKQLRAVRAAAEERIAKAAAQPAEPTAEQAAPPVVEGEMLEPGAMG
jgi:hypothetical protein